VILPPSRGGSRSNRQDFKHGTGESDILIGVSNFEREVIPVYFCAGLWIT